MKKIWWTWDIRMRWRYGFCHYAQSFEENYQRLISAAARRGVDAVVIWGFLRDIHGGVDSARRVVDFARANGIEVYPGVGIDCYGGVYYDGNSEYSLNHFLQKHPEFRAIREDGSPLTYTWPPVDRTIRYNMCPSVAEGIEFYQKSLHWLIDTFGIRGIQIENGDNGLCCCERCRNRKRLTAMDCGNGARSSISDAFTRIPAVLDGIWKNNPDFFVLWETYSGLTQESLVRLGPMLKKLPPEICISWQLYDGPQGERPGNMKIDPGVFSPSRRGCAAIRTNSDAIQGESDDTENIKEALRLSRAAGLTATYLYGEYPDVWPDTAKNYETWLNAADYRSTKE